MVRRRETTASHSSVKCCTRISPPMADLWLSSFCGGGKNVALLASLQPGAGQAWRCGLRSPRGRRLAFAFPSRTRNAPAVLMAAARQPFEPLESLITLTTAARALWWPD